MELTELVKALDATFSANFVCYYKSHVAHVNTKGRNFYQDHKLLKKIYEYLQEQIDPLAEKLRTCGAMMPNALSVVCETSPIEDSETEGSSVMLLQTVLDTVLELMDCYHKLRKEADAVDYTDISNMSDDAIGKLAKYKWQLEATIDIPLEVIEGKSKAKSPFELF